MRDFSIKAAITLTVSLGIASVVDTQTIQHRHLSAQMIPLSGFPPIYTPESETTTWAAQVVTNSSTVSAYQKWYVNRSIKAAKDNSLWTITDDIWALCAENSVQALTSWKGLRLGVATSTPTFVIKQGYTFGGSNYIDTTLNVSTAGGNVTGTSIHAGSYQTANGTSASRTFGAQGASTTTGLWLAPRVSGDTVASALLNTNANNTVASITDRRGYTSINKSSGPTYTIYKLGASVGTYTPSSSSANLPNASMYIGGLNNNGTFTAGISAEICWFDIGGSFTAPQEALWNSKVVIPYMKAMGVYTP